MTEKQVLAEIQSVVSKLATKFSFGIYDKDDIKQEATIIAIKSLEKYDPQKSPLSKFLYVHVRNRLTNLIRDEFHRNDPPCKLCHQAINSFTQHKDGKFCKKYLGWKRRNNAKASLAQPSSIQNYVDEEGEINLGAIEIDNSNQEIIDIIDLKISSENRKYFLQMLAGVSVSPYRKKQLVDEIRDILTLDEIEKILS